MITKIVHFVLVIVAFNSCTTLYKTGQTPDDVYYSPARPYVEEYIETARQESVIYHPEDRIIRMGINDSRWRNFDQDYRYNHYGTNYGNYYSPYFSPIYSQVFAPQYLPLNTSPRKENLGGYSPVIHYNSSNSKMGTAKPVKSYNNNNSGTAVGNIIRQIFTPDNSNNGSNYNSNNNSNINSNNNSSYNNNRTYSPPSTNTSSSSSSSGSSSSGGGGAISRPARGGGN